MCWYFMGNITRNCNLSVLSDGRAMWVWLSLKCKTFSSVEEIGLGHSRKSSYNNNNVQNMPPPPTSHIKIHIWVTPNALHSCVRNCLNKLHEIVYHKKNCKSKGSWSPIIAFLILIIQPFALNYWRWCMETFSRFLAIC